MSHSVLQGFSARLLASVLMGISASAALASKAADDAGAAPAAVRASTPMANRYKNHDIAVARFGDKDTQEIIKKAFKLEETVNQKIIGQQAPVAALQASVLQYLNSFESRKDVSGLPPIARHLIGFPGIGKSGIVEALKQILPVVEIDAQRYASKDAIRYLTWDLRARGALTSKKPVILLVEEIDKLREKQEDNSKEETSPFIGALNQLLNEGKISGDSVLDLSHVMVVTTMNLPTEVVEEFSSEVLKEKKSFFDFSMEDFAKFANWIDQDPSAVYKILSRMFRTNTVGRIGANAIIMNHLSAEVYRLIIDGTIRATMQRQTSGKEVQARRISATYDSSLVDYLFATTVFAPTGARDTVIKVNNAIEQLMTYGSRADKDGQVTGDRPRKIALSVDMKGLATIKVTTQKLSGTELVDDETFSITSQFNPRTAAFVPPLEAMAKDAPPSAVVKKKITQTMIRNARYPKASKSAKGLAKKMNEVLFGQEEMTQYLESEMSTYLDAQGAAAREPRSLILAGFPGIGKSEMGLLSGKLLGLPVVRVNLQQFSSTSDDAPVKFMDTLQSELSKAGVKPGQKYILMLEEIDKVAEINPNNAAVDRPILTTVKDILDRGTSTLTTKGDYGGTTERTIDVRGAFVIGTMNFGGKIFDFKADPRLTTIRDVMEKWRLMRMSIAQVKKTLERLFHPDTVNRLLPRVKIVKPLEEKDFMRVIEGELKGALRDRFVGADGTDLGFVTLNATPGYLKYVYGESVIPSEGARFTKDLARRLIRRDLEAAMKAVPQRYRSLPYEIRLGYDVPSTTVRAQIVIRNKKGQMTETVHEKHTVWLMFPDPSLQGKIPLERLETAAHEYGHGWMAARLGMRIETVSVIAPEAGLGGYVKYAGGNDQSARRTLSFIYAALASRATERIFMSADPLKTDSVLDITSGPSGDIRAATLSLFNMLNRLGFDPDGPTIEIDGGASDRSAKYADFDAIPHQAAVKLGLVLRDMENYIIRDFLAAHPREWHIKNIKEVARAGHLSEEQFFKILGWPAPPAADHDAFEFETQMHKDFGDVLEPQANAAKQAARDAKRGDLHETSTEVYNRYAEVFKASLKQRLYGQAPTPLKAAVEKPRIHVRATQTRCEALFVTH